ncbi:Ltp family lipoprotein [Gryllotalpicola ginsengisoli]|uniref:Ltp family lipoprotein n=1 Tax=Gryllotalpicola ginsengisoli TaxID=444608 RepID=UPI0003B399F0|nr:Ltp family lipoprotein [Gryllotalpicola ginsengisoli]
MSHTTPVAGPPAPQAPVPEVPQAPEPKKSKAVLGTWAVVLGVVGIVFALIPHAAGFGIFLAAVGILLGGIGLLRKGRRVRAGTGLSIVALILGIVFLNVYSGEAASDSQTDAAATGASAASAAPAAEESGSAAESGTSSAPKATSAAKATSAPKATSAAKKAKASGTASQLQALTAAEAYLSSGMGFSEQGLIDQLSSSSGNGFAAADAQWAVANSGADWNDQAVTSAKSYLSSGMGFSEQGLTDQLTSSAGSKFTAAQAQYAVAHSGADWNAQAVAAAKGYMSSGIGFSRTSLIDQLTSSAGSKFTAAQASYAADQVGLN